MHAPASLDEASALLRELAARRKTVGITGGASLRGPSAVPVDEVVSTRVLDRIVDYVPADQIVTAQAGMTIAGLQAVLRESKQRLALDPPAPDRTTVGGAVAAASYGPLRTRYGTAKDVIVGMTIVRADGTLARGGGKVVKNVAGFDIPKLMVGTYGTLAMIGTVTFRLHPLPEAQKDIVFVGCDASALRRLCAAMTQAQLEPSAVYAVYDGERYAACVRFEGFPAGVAAQCSAALALHPGDVREGASLRAVHDLARTSGDVQLKVTAPPSMVEDLHARAIAPLHAALLHARSVIYPVTGAGFLGGDCSDLPRVLDALTQARAWAESVGGTLVVDEAPPRLRAAFDSWGTPPPAFALMRALKERFDPDRRLNPGGFVGGL
ncbi:MAG TPA: FAD-binding oxidoreductase [Candidatus Baltobacteraceae bacterium]|nr:FAD-binding oxidoreductase [Candidatus Baltobacteraceae bacterium]